MMKDYTDIIVIMDRSGSMGENSKDVEAIRGYNSFVEDQKKGPGKCLLTLILFDSVNKYQVVFAGKNVQEAPQLTSDVYFPRGMTPYLDCIGKAIDEAGKRFDSLDEKDRPEKVIIVSISDGLENASVNYSRPKIKEMIEHQTDKYGWDFIFLGADFDAVAEAASIGVYTKNSATMDSANYYDGIQTVSANIRRYRNSGAKVDIGFTSAQRDTLAQKKSSATTGTTGNAK